MQLKRLLWYGAILLSILSILATIFTGYSIEKRYWRLPPWRGADDDPIIVAGGSMRVHNKKLQSDGHGGLNHPEGANRSVASVDILYNGSYNGQTGPDGESLAFNHKPVTVSLTYCPKVLGCGAGKDDVKITTDGTGMNLGITNNGHPIGNEAPDAYGARNHEPPDWVIKEITVNSISPAYPCDNGRCYVVVHYVK
jgi:hypothetical protein